MEKNDCPYAERTRNKGAIVKSSNWHIAEKNKDDYPKHLLNTAHRIPQAESGGDQGEDCFARIHPKRAKRNT